MRPLVIASFSLNYQLSGTSYAGWYALNFAVHLANVALVAFLVSRWARKLGVDGSLAACLAALVFGLSPLLAEGVFWVSARKRNTCSPGSKPSFWSSVNSRLPGSACASRLPFASVTVTRFSFSGALTVPWTRTSEWLT